MSNLQWNNRFKAIWKAIKPWLTAVAIFLILKYTGALSGISFFANSALLETGILNADPEVDAEKSEEFDYNFHITTINGEVIDVNSLRGKTIFLNMWATWCGPCRAEMPSIQSLYSKMNSDSVSFVMLSLDTENLPNRVANYVERKGFTFPVFIASNGLPEQLQVSTIPTTFIVSKDGFIVYKKSGLADYDTKRFKNYLEKLAVANKH